MTKEQAEALVWVSGWIAATLIFLSVIVWFMFISHQNTERERLKHETCMVVTKTYGGTTNPTVEVIAYCGDKEPTP